MTPLEIIKAVMKDLDNLGRCRGLISFCDEPRGNKQPSDIDGIDKVWVEQHGPGIIGDDYYGSVFVELEPRCFAEFGYDT